MIENNDSDEPCNEKPATNLLQNDMTSFVTVLEKGALCVVVFITGLTVAFHQSFDSRLGTALGSVIFAAFFNFIGGFLVLCPIWFVTKKHKERSLRRKLLEPQVKNLDDTIAGVDGHVQERHDSTDPINNESSFAKTKRISTFILLRSGGVCAAAIVCIGTYVIPEIGAALFAIESILMSQATSFIIDRLDLASRGRRPPLWMLAIIAVSFGGVVMASYDGLTAAQLSVVPCLVALLGGLWPIQTTLNVKYGAGRPRFQAELLSFVVALSLLTVISGALLIAQRPDIHEVVLVDAECSSYMLFAGLFGAGLTVTLKHSMQRIGIAVVMLCLYSGIISCAGVIDFFGLFYAPKPVTALRVAGICVTGVATIAYALAQHYTDKRPDDEATATAIERTPLLHDDSKKKTVIVVASKR